MRVLLTFLTLWIERTAAASLAAAVFHIESVPAPLWRDPVFDGAADPTAVFDHSNGEWRIVCVVPTAFFFFFFLLYLFLCCTLSLFASLLLSVVLHPKEGVTVREAAWRNLVLWYSHRICEQCGRRAYLEISWSRERHGPAVEEKTGDLLGSRALP